ncbi:MAG: hypothetical protein JF606_03585 [Burkholderiales bacterium]|nr:hypothetical protein [Burkholderiales bacterium]
MGAVRAVDLGFAADATHPFVRTGRRVAGLAGLQALEPASVDVLTASKERSEQRDLGFDRRRQVHAAALRMPDLGHRHVPNVLHADGHGVRG